MKTELFIFDMGEVVILDGVNLGEIADSLGIGRTELEKDYAKYEYPMMEGLMDTSLYMKHLESEFGVRTEGNLFRRIYSPRTNTSVIPALTEIRRRGGRSVIGSNTFAPHVERILSLPEKPLAFFDALYFSHEMHLSKPSLSFFRYILEKEHAAPDDALFIDDREENIRAASSLGLRTFLYSAERNRELLDLVGECFS